MIIDKIQKRKDFNHRRKAMLLEVSEAEYMGDYKINLIFNSGESKIIDLSKELKTGDAFYRPIEMHLLFENVWRIN